ncbi:hypothetical protein HGB24_01505 [Candidatus Saccharibacteria bacterium]|nr:hypothetical protein [Candidatus Saccharibacteria bacterium]
MKKSRWIVIVLSALLIMIVGTSAVFIIDQKASSPSSNSQNQIKSQVPRYYLIAIDDKGRSGEMIGCGDSLVLVSSEATLTDNLVKASLEKLLSIKTQYYGESGLYNALYQSSVGFVNSSISGDTVTVNLTGNFVLGGECDNPRVESQLEKTAAQAAGVSNASIFVDGKALRDVLSLK